jgi:6-phospho-beta-glucosidase
LSMKVAVIGGGSTYTPELLNGIIARAASFPLRELLTVEAAVSGDRRAAYQALLAHRLAQHLTRLRRYSTIYWRRTRRTCRSSLHKVISYQLSQR